MDWDLYISQLRSLIQKNYKKKKTGHFNILIACHIIISLAIISFIRLQTLKKYEYDEVDSVKPVPINEIYINSVGGHIGFIVPPETNNSGTRQLIVDSLNNNIMFFENPRLKRVIFEDINSFENFKLEDGQFWLASIILNNNYTDYTIRIADGNVVNPDENPIGNYYESREHEFPDSVQYLHFFSPLQVVTNQAILQAKTNKTFDIDFRIGKLSKPKIKLALSDVEKMDKSLSIKSLLYPAIFFLQCLSIIADIMSEKEKGIEQGLLVIGVHPSTIWLSWEIFYSPIILLASVLSVLIEIKDLYRSINLIFVFFYIFIYGLSIYGFSVMMTKFFKNTKNAFLIVFLFLFSLIFIDKYIYLLEENHSILLKLICTLLSPVNLTIGLTKIIENNYRGIYISFNNFFSSGFGIYFILLIFSLILYYLIIFGIEFFSFKFYNLFKSKSDFNQSYLYEKDIEADPSDCGKPFVEVKNIFKVYKTRGDHLFSHKNVNVLNGVSFNVYKDETFGILGHNGAGKSTLIKIMTGLLKSDGGNVYYKGLELTSNLNKIRKRIGLCLQDTIAFDELTIEDNLYIFAGLKNTYIDIDNILEDIGLEEKRFNKVEELSGGQKRKLCIGLSLIGNPKFIFLDEPTTSLDPLSRRKIWEILMKIKKNRVIFLCTHYMDEADILCDRKMIINHGTIRCLGSSVYLKNHFNMKYLLNIETKLKYKEDINRVILNHIPEAKFLDIKNQGNDLNKTTTTTTTNNNNNNNSLTYLSNNNDSIDQICYYTWGLPMSSTNKYYNLLSELELLKGKMLNQISLDSPYFEDLFIKLTSESFEKKAISHENENYSDFDIQSITEVEEIPKLEKIEKLGFLGKTLRFMKYRFFLYLRNRTFILVYLLPFVILGLLFYTIKDDFNKTRFLHYNDRNIGLPEIYDGNLWNYDINGSNIKNSFTKELMEKTMASLDKEGLSNSNITSKNQTYLSYYSKEEMETIGKKGNTPYYVSSFSISQFDNTYQIDLYYNDSMPHSIPVTINTISNAILSLNNIQETISIHSHPYDYNVGVKFKGTESAMMVVVLCCISFVVSFFGPIIIREKAEKLLKQLYLNGITDRIYWLATFLVSFVLLYVLVMGIVGLFSMIGLNAFCYSSNIIILAILQFFGCISTLFFQYFASLYLEDEGISYILYIVANILPPFISMSQTLKYQTDSHFYHHKLDNIYGSLVGLLGSILYPVMNMPKAFFELLRIHILTEKPIPISTLLEFNGGDGFIFLLIGNIASVLFFFLIFVFCNDQIHKLKIGRISVRSKKNIEKNVVRLKELDEDVYKEYQRVTNIIPQKKESIDIISVDRDAKTINLENDNENEMDDTSSRETIVNKEKKSVENEKFNQLNNEIPIRVVHVGKEYTVYKYLNKDIENIMDIISNPNPKYGEYHYSDYDFGGPVITSLTNVSLGINNRECFGLIGPNGAGKSSLLNILTYNHVQTAGKVYYDGIENTSIREDRFMIGYCPQNDYLWPELTLYEQLVMFINLRGYSLQKSKEYAKQYLAYCKIEEHKNKYPHELSGGTKRKLCVLLALICFSNKIILDEPSSGMDPATRRYIWNVLTNYKNNEDSCIVLTTHSMEEAEMLCDRIGILINGELRAIGSPTHLKMKFGDMYILELQSPDSKLVTEQIKKDIPVINEKDTIIENKSNKRVRYTFKITQNHGEIFRIMENYKEENLVTDYSFTQLTLEDIFLKFANLQENQEMLI